MLVSQRLSETTGHTITTASGYHEPDVIVFKI